MAIRISINAGKDAATSSVTATGEDYHVITDKEVSSFKLNDASLKKAIAAYFGKAPEEAWLKGPTGKHMGGDLFKYYNWKEVTTNLVVESARITDITSEPTIVDTKTFTNTYNKPADVSAGIQQQVTRTSEHNWSQTDTVSAGQEISYGVEFLGTGGGGKTSMNYSHAWGQSKTESESVTVGSTSDIKVTLDPGESVMVRMTATKGTLNVLINYRAYLDGGTATNYGAKQYQGHYYWYVKIGPVMSSGNLPNSFTYSEKIKVGYYSETNTEILDPKTGRVLARFGSDFEPGVEPGAAGFSIGLEDPEPGTVDPAGLGGRTVSWPAG